jgi:acyl-coenzyme A thioesterase 13
MHGGAAGVIFDMATTSALCPVARPGFWEFMGGVTRTLNISYLKAVPVGTTVRLSSKVESVGKQMAMIPQGQCPRVARPRQGPPGVGRRL